MHPTNLGILGKEPSPAGGVGQTPAASVRAEGPLNGS